MRFLQAKPFCAVYAQIDIKNATITMQDGYGATITGYLVNKTVLTGFEVNNVSGYMAGATTMLVDTGTGVIQTGTHFTVAGETGSPLHAVTAHTEVLGATTSITFTPALVSSVIDTAAITLYAYGTGDTTMLLDGGTVPLTTGDRFTVTGDTTAHTISAHSETLGITTSVTFTPAITGMIADNAPITIQPHSIEINIGEGNLTWTEKKTYKYIHNRGKLDTVRQEDEDPVDVSIEALWEFITSDTGEVPTIDEVLKKRGNAANWLTSAEDPCEPYAVDLLVNYNPPCAEVKNELIILSDFRYESFEHDLKAGTFKIQGKCNITEANVTRTTVHEDGDTSL